MHALINYQLMINIAHRLRINLRLPFEKELMTFSNTKVQRFEARFDASINQARIKERNQYFQHLKEKFKQSISEYAGQPIEVKLKDGKVIKAQAFKTTPHDICRQISKKLAQDSVVARVKYVTKKESPYLAQPVDVQKDQQTSKKSQFQNIDLFALLEGDCQIEFLNFEDQLGKQTFWHSSAHILGQALENVYGAWLCHGPPIHNGFFYDSFLGQQTISQTNYEQLQKQIRKSIQQKQNFERLLITKAQALTMFAGNPFKQYLIRTKIPDGGITSVYRCGNLVDLCTGPHVPSTHKIKGFQILKNSSSYFLGRKQNDNLQRIYGISFPKQSQLDAFIKNQQQLLKRDHRVIGPKQHLFNFTHLSPGSALFLPHGTIIYNRLIELMRSEYNIRGYKEVISPNLYHSQLWKTSGHYFKYKQNIFFFKEGEEEQGLKPMNCPGHCLIFDQTQYSYRELPIRMADFGVLHRNELTGALSGLTRVRRFQQDDAHIFCRPDQIQSEILGVLDLLDYIYTVFGFKYVLELSTRPEQYLGNIEDWDKAESQLKEALTKFGKEYKINAGDGAFYGPKIDVKLFDAFGREHQCGTVQLDFQLPLRFNLQYRSGDLRQKKETKHTHSHDESCKHGNEALTQQMKYSQIKPLKNGFERPVIIHRAIFGSLERFIAILCQHNGGKWDFWISPRQIKLLSIGQQSHEFTNQVYNSLLLKGYSVQKDISQDNLGKKIRNAQTEGFNFMGIIGKEEVRKQEINIRSRQSSQQPRSMNIESLLQQLQKLKPPKSQKRKQLERMSLI